MRIIALFLLLLFYISGSTQIIYPDYFTGKRLRYNYVIAGNHQQTQIFGYQLIQEPFWGGSEINLIDTFRYGELFFEISDSASGKVIYSRGCSSLFKEWQMVGEAKCKERAFVESLVFPFPKSTVKLIIYERDTASNFQVVHSIIIDPDSLIMHYNQRNGIIVRNVMTSGLPGKKVDIAVIAEGYTLGEEEVFFKAAEKYIEHFFSWEPYKSHRDKFNFYAVFVPSNQSGTDVPCDSVWKHTALNTSFNTFESERYLTTPDISVLREIAAEIPYDQLCVLVNTDKYGGGGIYNSFTVFSGNNEFSGFLFLHEFGHAFAGLADEYYTSPTAYDEIVTKHIEPYQPNITTRIDFDSKWKDMVSDTIPVPTPNCEKYAGVIGVFEGAAYQANGIYRPAYDCAMKSKTCNEFCPVCQRAIERMIYFYCE